MCEEGGCGACSVIEMINTGSETGSRAVSACLVPLAQCDGKTFITTKAVGGSKTGKQLCETFASSFASQCGYCTPGIVAGTAAYQTSDERETELDGHICRCTGYRPIKDAIKKSPIIDIEELGELCAKCPSRKSGCESTCGKVPLRNGNFWHRPKSMKELEALLTLPNSKILSGNTSKHVEKYYQKVKAEYENIIDVSSVQELHMTSSDGNFLKIGSSVSIQSFLNLVSSIPANSVNIGKIKSALTKVGSVSMREQGTLAGSLFLQKRNPSFCSDISVILACFNATITIVESFNWREGEKNSKISIPEFMKANLSENALLTSIEMNIPTAGQLTIGKVTPRPTMSAGYITYAFCTESENASYFYNNGNGLDQISAPTSFTPEGFNTSLGGVEDISIRAQLLKHYSQIQNLPIEPLRFDQVSYNLDDSSQPEKSKNVPQQHAVQLADGSAGFPSDVPPAAGQLHLAFVKAKQIGNIESIKFENFEKNGDFVKLITAKDLQDNNIKNNFQPEDEADEKYVEEIVCSKSVLYINQPIAIIVAKTRQAALLLRDQVQVEYSVWSDGDLKQPTADFNEAVERQDFHPNPTMGSMDQGEKGNVAEVFENGNYSIIEGQFDQPGQYHNFMETHFASVVVNDRQVEVDVGSQAIDKVQRAVAKCFNLPHASVSAKCRRTGGGFGGKATRSLWIAVTAASATKITGKSCSLHLPLEDCIQIMGGRSIYRIKYKAAFDLKTGKCMAVDMKLFCDTGAVQNDNIFSGMLFSFHGDGAFGVPNYKFECKIVRTARPSVTWLRAPGMLQADLAIDRVIEHGIRKLKLDVDVITAMKSNLAKPGDVNIPGVPDNTDRTVKCFDNLYESSDYKKLEAEVHAYNEANKWKKKGIAIQAMRYPHDVSFHISSVIVNVMKYDGSVHASVGGIDMGQGQHTRCAQVIANNLGCSLDNVFIKPTSTDVNANTSPTGGTISTHVMLLLLDKATDNLKKRMSDHATENDLEWSALVAKCANIDLQERYQGAFKSDGSSYCAYGSSLAVVELDVLTGEHVIERMDVMFDAGEMINVGIELGQIEGGLIMSLGWLKTENLTWNNATGSEQAGTWDYKVPMHKDLPKNLKITLNKAAPEFENGPLTGKKNNYPMSSKQAGEAAMSLGFSYINALSDAIAAFNPDAQFPELPATPKSVFKALALSSDQLTI